MPAVDILGKSLRTATSSALEESECRSLDEQVLDLGERRS